MVDELARAQKINSVESGGARQAAKMIADLL
jgi:hypothetical protein